MPMRIARRLRESFDEPGCTIDFFVASLLMLAGIYFLHPGWVHLRYPRIAGHLVEMFPLWAYGVCLTLLGALTAIATITRSDRILILCFSASFGCWCAISLMFCIGTITPPMEGLMAPAIAALSVIRTSQLAH